MTGPDGGDHEPAEHSDRPQDDQDPARQGNPRDPSPPDRTRGADPRAAASRELRLALLLILAGAGLLFLAGGRDWATGTLPAAPPLPPTRLTATGSTVVSGLSGLAVLGLSGLAAVAATKGRGRALVGALLAAAGVVTILVVVLALAGGAADALRAADALGSPSAEGSFTAWPYAGIAAGLLLTAGGLVIAIRGQRWAALSSRYEAPAARAERSPPRPEVAAWDALDRGQDPTAAAPGPGGPDPATEAVVDPDREVPVDPTLDPDPTTAPASSGRDPARPVRDDPA